MSTAGVVLPAFLKNPSSYETTGMVESSTNPIHEVGILIYSDVAWSNYVMPN